MNWREKFTNIEGDYERGDICVDWRGGGGGGGREWWGIELIWVLVAY